MAKIRIEDTIMSSAFPGFGFSSILSGTLVVSGTVPNGNRTYDYDFTVPNNVFVIAYYTNNDTSSFSKGRYRVGNMPNAAIDGVGNNTFIYGTQTGTNYRVEVEIDNFSGGPLTVPTQNLLLEVYLFQPPF